METGDPVTSAAEIREVLYLYSFVFFIEFFYILIETRCLAAWG
jgi:hypothetical protein